ncbi:NADPH:quinone oxidoreductase family protein [Enterovirga sp.]|jgi:NADPH2:quinone reductase|uniref:NADPH:quinone oxidoreductase family protein n=1 Tax=Enterovirga sp. TaxID=2026350 RepID=UPI0026313658|nr:NADPH:quinone oxidoreductase family protein [Enterovirga sp.]MDB5589551.1 NADPH:quinone oxidoreductase [Enterovirga sp.]
MRAILSRIPGGPETLTLEEVEEPTPGPGEVRLAVRAVGINYPDVLIIQDKYQVRPERPFSPGAEAAGIVDAVGPGVVSFRAGDRVLAMPGHGALAEKVLVPEQRCARLPDSMPFDEAAAFLMTYGTSHHGLADRGRLKAGETLLVLGAAGGVGLAAVEIGAALGARVVAAVSSEEKLALARSRGAAEGFIYPPGPFDAEGRKSLADAFKRACGPGGADVVYDPVGGDYAEPALRAIAWRGRYLVVGFPAGIPKLPLNLLLLKGCDVVGVFWGAFVEREPDRHAAALAELFRLYEAGRIRPEVSARFLLERASEAIEALASRRALGKIVVMVP